MNIRCNNNNMILKDYNKMKVYYYKKLIMLLYKMINYNYQIMI